MGIVENRDDADDIVQQAITIAIQKNEVFESEAHFVGWLAGIVRNCALNYRRKQTRRKTQVTDPADLSFVENSGGNDENPVDRLTGELDPMQSSFDDRMRLALEQVSPQSRSCLLLRTVEGLSYAEISKLMDVPEGTAMSLVHRGKKLLRTLLRESADHDENSIRKKDNDNDDNNEGRAS